MSVAIGRDDFTGEFLFGPKGPHRANSSKAIAGRLEG